MAQGEIALTGTLATSAPSDVFPTHQAIYGKGGLRTVASNTERDGIPTERRELGMMVYVENAKTYYTLVGGLTNSHWEPFEAGSGGGASASLPSGGAQGQVLVKQSATDGDADWESRNWVGYGANLPDPSSVPDGAMFFKGDGSPFALMKGADGANGVSGFVPDIDKKITLTTTTIDSKTFSTVAPDDGYVVFDLTTGTTATAIYASINGDTFGQRINVPSGSRYVNFLIVKKGDTVKIETPYVFSKNPIFYFYPIYKPELTEEHIVGYLAGKPVYEAFFSGTTPSASGNIMKVPDNFDKCISLSGVIYRESEGYQTQVSFAHGGDPALCIKGEYFYIYLTSTYSKGKPILINFRYTKTTD